ncbi:MAG: hypothetical protein GTO16_01275 [Candidatus Aminicenantes bacterium]|nr:hypothetical protein [Candidatus Aminicenantes bacterium]
MPEARMLARSISRSKSLGRLKSDSARLLYTWLIPFLDVEGRYFADPEIVKGYVFPKTKSMTPLKINRLLQELAENKLIILYSANGETFLQFKKFHELQPGMRPEREAKSIIPKPSSGLTLANSRTNKIKLNKSKLNKSKQKDDVEKEFEEFWDAYDYKIHKADALRAYKALRQNENKKTIAQALHGYEDYLKHRRIKEKFEQRKMYPATFLRSDRWKDFIDFKFEPGL